MVSGIGRAARLTRAAVVRSSQPNSSERASRASETAKSRTERHDGGQRPGRPCKDGPRIHRQRQGKAGAARHNSARHRGLPEKTATVPSPGRSGARFLILPPRMPSSPPKRHKIKPDGQRALELLASCPDGCPEALMIAHGFSIEQIVRLVRDGLATASAERVRAGRETLEVARVRITDAGRRALNGGND